VSNTATDAAAPAADPAPPPAAAEGATPAAAPASWRDALPAELRDAPSLTKFNDPAALAKGYIEAEALIGRKGVIVPSEKDGPEVVAKFREALGVPEKPEGYALTAPEGVPAEVWDVATATAFQQQAHALGLTPAQAKGLAEWYARGAAAQMQRLADGIEPDGRRMDDVLREEWGNNFDRKVALAQRAMKAFGDEAAISAFEARAGGAAVVRMMARIGEALAEDLPAGMTGEARRALSTPDEMQAERTRLMAAGGPYWDKMHPEHKATVARVYGLAEAIAAARERT
jgi:hypothetical protein